MRLVKGHFPVEFIWSLVIQLWKSNLSAMSSQKPAGSLTDRFAAIAWYPEWSIDISCFLLLHSLCFNRHQGWSSWPLPRIQAVLSTVKRSNNSASFKPSIMFFAFLNVRSSNLSRAFLVGQLLVQCSIKQVVPCVWVHWTHTKCRQAILTCFFLIFAQWLQFHIVLFLPSHASLISATSILSPQNKGHLTYSCDETAVFASVSSQHALAPQWAVNASGEMHSRLHS